MYMHTKSPNTFSIIFHQQDLPPDNVFIYFFIFKFAGANIPNSSGRHTVNSCHPSEEKRKSSCCGHLLWTSKPTQKNHHKPPAGKNSWEFLESVADPTARIFWWQDFMMNKGQIYLFNNRLVICMQVHWVMMSMTLNVFFMLITFWHFAEEPDQCYQRGINGKINVFAFLDILKWSTNQ